MSRWRQRKNAASTTEEQPEAHEHPRGEVRVQRALDEHLAAHDRVDARHSSSSPESTAEIGVGPSACASGSQLWSGASPTFVP